MSVAVPEKADPVLNVLRDVRDLLGDERSWTKGALARDRTGQDVHESDSTAVSFCLVGAFWRATPQGRARARSLAMKELEVLAENRDLGAWNDAPERTFEDVANLLDAAIAEREMSK